jgi:hypothetical protein
MSGDSIEIVLASGSEWLLAPDELTALRSTRRLFMSGLAVTASLALGAAAATAWVAGAASGWAGRLVSPALATVLLAAVAAWCLNRARFIGQDVRAGRAETQWGRVTRVWPSLRVAEVDGALFPLQLSTVPVLRRGERVHLRFAPRSRITFEIRTLREVVVAERLAGRPVCPAALAELEPGERPFPDPSRGDALQPETPGNRGGRGPDCRIAS